MKPILLLIPGMFNTPAIFDAVRAHLEPEVEVRVADVATQSSIAQMAEDAWKRVADVPDRTPLIVAGYSMGGYVTVELLARQHARIDAAAFIDSSARTDTSESRVNREKTIAALERNFEKTVSGIIAFSLHPQSVARAELVDGMRSMMHSVGAQTAIRQTRAIMDRSDHRVMLSSLDMPTLVICGRADKVTPPVLSEELAALVPGARLTWLEQSGHQTPLEQPAELAEALLQLVRSASRSKQPTGTP
jgi:pimeloyl-ACP methyl ester carboxylesterase